MFRVYIEALEKYNLQRVRECQSLATFFMGTSFLQHSKE